MREQLHFNICKEMDLELDKEHWYEYKYVPKSVEMKFRSSIA
jgi:hypothetical protein